MSEAEPDVSATVTAAVTGIIAIIRPIPISAPIGIAARFPSAPLIPIATPIVPVLVPGPCVPTIIAVPVAYDAAKAPMDRVVAAIAANAIFFKFIVIFGAPIPDRSPYPRA
jgi:hypothetical protein